MTAEEAEAKLSADLWMNFVDKGSSCERGLASGKAITIAALRAAEARGFAAGVDAAASLVLACFANTLDENEFEIAARIRALKPAE